MIDTRNKRSSAIQPMMPWRGMLPAPDGTIDAADRVQLLYLYAGFGVVVVGDTVNGVLHVTFTVTRPEMTFSVTRPEMTFEVET